MAYFYVRDHADGVGTADGGDGGRYATKQTGDWDTTLGATTGYYSGLRQPFLATTPPVAGDFIFVSNISSHSAAFDVILSGPSTGSVHVVSVNDTAIDQYLAGAVETPSARDVQVTGGVDVMGVDFILDDDISTNAIGSHAAYKDCTMTLTGSSDSVTSLHDGCTIAFTNVVLQHDTAGSFVNMNRGSIFSWFGGALTATTTVTDLINDGFLDGGAAVSIVGVDLTPITGHLLAAAGLGATEDTIDVTIMGCKLNASLTGFVEEAFVNPNKIMRVFNSSSSSAAAEYQFFIQQWTGTVEDYTATYRDQSQAFDGGTNVSIEAISNANASTFSPMVFDLPVRFAELSVGATDTLEIYLTSDAALTDTDVWVELIYPDGTNKQTFNYFSTLNADPLAAGTTLTTDAVSTWTAGKTNKYVISASTAGDVGSDGVPIVRINVGIASTTVYFDTEAGLA